MKSRTAEGTLQLNDAETARSLRLLLGRLSQARNERLHLVDCAGREERRDERHENYQLEVDAIVLAQSRRNQRVLQQLHPLLVALLANG